MDDLAERYVKLVLAVGVHDADYVDAYYGPPEWRAAAAAARRSVADLEADAAALLAAVESRPPGAELRRARAAAAPVSQTADRVAAVASRDAGRRAVGIRRRIEAALRRRRADAYGAGIRRRARRARATPARHGLVARALSGVSRPLHDPEGPAVRRIRRRDRGLPRAYARAHRAAGRRELHDRVRDEQELERLQLVSGQLPQPDPDQHGLADLHRSRDRSGLSRRLPRAPRL